MQQISSSKFAWSPAQRVFITEVSDGLVLRGQFEMVSEKTQKVAEFRYAYPTSDGDGDVHSFIFLPSPEAVKKNPKLKDVKVVVLND